ncbi:hypothetical protein OPT61_g4933 [Boeremia exigua]|uniref:Uncharacterized protein n=1 Tax=Boeremia exigua TaxID=749465 RepID=A0ACC2ICD8_9PLEO|nr:hypothetical protein OPT61_g4933 [Boeremia exigua]
MYMSVARPCHGPVEDRATETCVRHIDQNSDYRVEPQKWETLPAISAPPVRGTSFANTAVCLERVMNETSSPDEPDRELTDLAATLVTPDLVARLPEHHSMSVMTSETRTTVTEAPLVYSQTGRKATWHTAENVYDIASTGRCGALTITLPG